MRAMSFWSCSTRSQSSAITAWKKGTSWAAHSCALAICCCIGPMGERPNRFRKGLLGIFQAPRHEGAVIISPVRAGGHPIETKRATIRIDAAPREWGGAISYETEYGQGNRDQAAGQPGGDRQPAGTSPDEQAQSRRGADRD